MDARANMLAVVRTVHVKGIVCLEHMLHLVVRDALGLGSTAKPTWDAAPLDLNSRTLRPCLRLAGA